MKIIKIPITEQNREVYWSRNKDKKAWEKLMSECPSMTSKEFWNNEWEEFDKEEISTHWYFIVGKPESIIDELINLEIGDTNVFYPHIKENRPWDIEEMDWYDQKRRVEAHKAKMAAKRAEICERYDKKIRQAEAEKKIMLCVFDYGLSTDNVIYYSHTNTLSFNWNGYGEKITQEEFDDFVNKVDRSQLPEGIKFELK